MQSLRNSIFRSVAVWLILPGYVLLLSADRRNDGSFACWLNLALASHTGVVGTVALDDVTKSADTVAEAIKNASVWAESQSSDDSATPERDSNALYSLLIGEWKDYRQVNTSATAPSERPEIRDGKALQRFTSPTATADRSPEISVTRPFTRAEIFSATDARNAIHCEPMVSGMAMGAP